MVPKTELHAKSTEDLGRGFSMRPMSVGRWEGHRGQVVDHGPCLVFTTVFLASASCSSQLSSPFLALC